MAINPVCYAITEINFRGHIIPHQWWLEITFSNGKPDHVAILLLADICYWYRLEEVLDEATGKVTGYRKKFKADKLQKSYQAYATQFGFSKRQAQDAIGRLVKGGWINRELRTITEPDGVRVGNVVYLEPVPEKIQAISGPSPGGPVNTNQRKPSHVKTGEGSHSNGRGSASERETNTKSTAETISESGKESPLTPQGGDGEKKPSKPKKAAQPDYSPEFEAAWKDYPARAGDNPKPAAWKAWTARLNEGHTTSEMHEGAKRYAAFIRITEKEGTEFVKHAATFFGPSKPFLADWTPPPPKLAPKPAEPKPGCMKPFPRQTWGGGQ